MRYDQGSPTDSEQYLLCKLNRARLDPAGEGQRLAAWLRNTAYGQSVITKFGTNPDQVASDFAALPAVPPLAFDPSLLSAARAHSADLAAHNGLGPNGDAHSGYDGSTWAGPRDLAAGYAGTNQGEGVVVGADTLDTIHAAFSVDWGVPDLGHRVTRMDGVGGDNVVGIGVVSFTNSTLIETEDFGAPKLVVNATRTAQVFTDTPALVTGVVYRDANGNGQYDMGEGVAGVTITMDGGSYYAVTTASGGYALPLVHTDGSNVDGTATVRMAFADGSTAGQSVSVVRHGTDLRNSTGTYRANVGWDVNVAVLGQTASFFAGSASLGGGWNYLAFPVNGNLFGYYNVSLYPYLYHNDLGWEYVLDAQDSRQGVYLYDFASGDWWYTSPSFAFPYLYDFTRQTILYYYPADGRPGFYSSQPRYFYDFAAKKIVSL